MVFSGPERLARGRSVAQRSAGSAELTALAERILIAATLSEALGEKAKPARKRSRR